MTILLSLLVDVLLYIAVGSVEWWMALRRTLACARGETTLLITLTFTENLLGLWVLSSFIRDNNWIIAISYCIGAALGAYVVSRKMKN